jgi:hypothetical protein
MLKSVTKGGLIILARMSVGPIVMIIFLFLFTDPIANLITRITSLEYKNFKAQFSAGIVRAQELTSQQPPYPAISSQHCAGPQEDRNRLETLFQLADDNGKGAVMDSFREMELAAIGAALKRSLAVTGPQGRVSGIAAIESLERARIITKPMADRYRSLRDSRKLANDVKFQVETEQAKFYTCEALTLAEELRGL